MDDYVTFALLVSSAFFVAISAGLLVRYRQVSQKLTASSDLGKDLWEALDLRLKKQDERLVDLLARIEVLQTRVVSSSPLPRPISGPPVSEPEGEKLELAPGGSGPVMESRSMTLQPVTPLVTPVIREESPLSEKEILIIKLLSDGPRDTISVRKAIRVESREHAARLLKDLFDRGLVERNESTKPYVYQLTDEGRRRLSAS